jgi:hypothetical protein
MSVLPGHADGVAGGIGEVLALAGAAEEAGVLGLSALELAQEVGVAPSQLL